jgi:hypothetical protein
MTNRVEPLAMNNPNRQHDRRYFYKYVTPSTATAILGSRTLRWSSPQIFNDPFDTPRNLTFDCAPRELQEALAEELARLIESGANTPPNALPMLDVLLSVTRNAGAGVRAALATDLRVNALKDIPEPLVGFRGFQDYWDNAIPAFRILCMSETPTSTAMWAHYADSHRGVVLEFEADDAVDSPLLMARPVRYQDEPPKLPSKPEWIESIIGRKKIDMKEFFTEYQFTKSLQWSGEKEWRVVSYARPGETGLFADYHFDATELRRVIVGANCSAEDQATIGALVATYADASVVRARIDHDSRKIEL